MSKYKDFLGEIDGGKKRKEEGKPGPAPDPQSLTAQLERGEVSQLKVLVPEELHTELKVRAARTKRTMSEMVAEALTVYLRG